MLQTLMAGLINLVYPSCCLLCKTPLKPLEKTLKLCFACQSKIELNHPPFCGRCSRPLDNPVHRVCQNCQDITHHFDRAWAGFIFNETFQKLLHRFKYGHKTGLRHYFVHGIMAFKENYGLPANDWDLITPVPLHPVRLRERGYNQSEIIARMLAEEWRIPLNSKDLLRSRHTPHQARQHQKERWTNIEAAFKIRPHNNFRQKQILLVDDLITTGATVSAAAQALKEAGALRVDVIAVAIAHKS